MLPYINRIPEYPEKILCSDMQPQIPNFFNLRKNHRTAIFVDGPNITFSGKIGNRRINFDCLRLLFEQHSDLRFSNYYSPIYRDKDFISITQRFFEYLTYSRWTVISREGFYMANGRYRSYDIDSLLSTQLQQIAASGKIDTILIVSNDGDYVPVIQTCRQAYGVRFLHLSWSVQNGENYARPSHNLRIESEISLDISMTELSDYLLMPIKVEDVKPDTKAE